jgi:DNA modification methylase
MKIRQIAIDKIIPYAGNPRKNQAAVEKVAISLNEFGWQQAIVVDTEMVVIAGHTRLLAAKQLGMPEVPVLIADKLTPAQVKAYRLADNRTHEESGWDQKELARELGEIGDLDYDLRYTGFNPEEIKGLKALAEALEKGLKDEDDCPALSEKPVSRLGDLWLLGRHRLMCGDSTHIDAVEQLIAGGLADMVFTDPPYNVDYEGYTEDKLKITHDKMSDAQFTKFLLDIFASYFTAVKKGASMYVCHGSIYQREFQNALEANGFAVRNQIIWAKNHFAWGRGRYKFQHEPIFYCYLKGTSDPWYGDKTQSTLWQIDKPNANRLHPTMKPVSLVEMALQNSSKAGDIVLDLFGGSGSTLIACEKTARNARLMELDPKYCDVIIKRWQDFTGNKALLLGEEQIFDDMATERLKAG